MNEEPGDIEKHGLRSRSPPGNGTAWGGPVPTPSLRCQPVAAFAPLGAAGAAEAAAGAEPVPPNGTLNAVKVA